MKKTEIGKRDFSGMWRIVKMSEWDKKYCDSEVNAFIAIKSSGSGEFQFGLVIGSVCGDFKKTAEGTVFDFTFEATEEFEQVSGDGWMKLKGKDDAEGEIRFHMGDSSTFKAKRMKDGKKIVSSSRRVKK